MPAPPVEPESEDDVLSDPPLDIDAARSDNASLKLERIDLACVFITAGTDILEPLLGRAGVEELEVVNFNVEPAESEDAMFESKGN